MKTLSVFIFLFVICKVALSNEPIACGKEWINIHKGNPELIGIYASQLPDNVEDQKSYRDKHPVAVYYLFSDHMMHVVTYTPTGQVQDGRWWSAEDSEWLYKKVKKEFKENVFCAFWVK